MKNLKKFIASLLVIGVVLSTVIVEAKPAPAMKIKSVMKMSSIDGPTIPPMK